MDHLALHVMVRNLDTPDKEELRKLQQLKDELVSEKYLLYIYCSGWTINCVYIMLRMKLEFPFIPVFLASL